MRTLRSARTDVLCPCVDVGACTVHGWPPAANHSRERTCSSDHLLLAGGGARSAPLTQCLTSFNSSGVRTYVLRVCVSSGGGHAHAGGGNHGQEPVARPGAPAAGGGRRFTFSRVLGFSLPRSPTASSPGRWRVPGGFNFRAHSPSASADRVPGFQFLRALPISISRQQG